MKRQTLTSTLAVAAACLSAWLAGACSPPAQAGTGPRYKELSHEVIPVGDDGDRFFVVYSSKQGVTGELINNVKVSLFELASEDGVRRALIFGSGYGNRRPDPEKPMVGARNTVGDDLAVIDGVLRGPMGLPAGTPIVFVVPHAHIDHINPEFLRELEANEYPVEVVWVHVDDEQPMLTRKDFHWTEHERELVRTFGTTGASCEQSAEEAGFALETTIGRVWFRLRPGHSPGAVDLILDHRGDADRRWVMLGSAMAGSHGAGACELDGIRGLFRAHGNTVFLTPEQLDTQISVLEGRS